MNTQYSKTYVAAIGTILMAVQSVVISGNWPTWPEWVAIAIAAIITYGVWQTPNRPAQSNVISDDASSDMTDEREVSPPTRTDHHG